MSRLCGACAESFALPLKKYDFRGFCRLLPDPRFLLLFAMKIRKNPKEISYNVLILFLVYVKIYL